MYKLDSTYVRDGKACYAFLFHRAQFYFVKWRVCKIREKKKKRKEKKTLFALIKIIVLQIHLESLMARIKELIRNSFFFGFNSSGETKEGLITIDTQTRLIRFYEKVTRNNYLRYLFSMNDR